jgi:hypothetical protein
VNLSTSNPFHDISAAKSNPSAAGGMNPSYEKAPGAVTCAAAVRVDSADECERAGAAVGYPFNKVVDAGPGFQNGAGRPGGCFWDQSGSSYFNRNLNSTATWGGVGGICRRVDPEASQTTPPADNAIRCANEGEQCAFRGSTWVRYGANRTWISKQLNNGTPCSNAVFGDPLPGILKACYISNSGSVLPCGKKVKLKSQKGDYLHRPDGNPAVTTWSEGIGNVWTVECKGDTLVMLRSWKGDYLHRPEGHPALTTWSVGIGNEWIAGTNGTYVSLKSWKGDYLHRPEGAPSATTRGTGVGNNWTVEVLN